MHPTDLTVETLCLWGIIVVSIMLLVTLPCNLLYLRKDRIRRKQEYESIKSKRAKGPGAEVERCQ